MSLNIRKKGYLKTKSSNGQESRHPHLHATWEQKPTESKDCLLKIDPGKVIKGKAISSRNNNF